MPLVVRPPFSLSLDVFVHPVRPDSNSRWAIAVISLEKTPLSANGKYGPPNAIGPRGTTRRRMPQEANGLSNLKGEYDELQDHEKDGWFNGAGGRVFNYGGRRFDYIRAGLQMARSRGR